MNRANTRTVFFYFYFHFISSDIGHNKIENCVHLMPNAALDIYEIFPIQYSIICCFMGNRNDVQQTILKATKSIILIIMKFRNIHMQIYVFNFCALHGMAWHITDNCNAFDMQSKWKISSKFNN